jgi:hypothetical protein
VSVDASGVQSISPGSSNVHITGTDAIPIISVDAIGGGGIQGITATAPLIVDSTTDPSTPNIDASAYSTTHEISVDAIMQLAPFDTSGLNYKGMLLSFPEPYVPTNSNGTILVTFRDGDGIPTCEIQIIVDTTNLSGSTFNIQMYSSGVPSTTYNILTSDGTTWAYNGTTLQIPADLDMFVGTMSGNPNAYVPLQLIQVELVENVPVDCKWLYEETQRLETVLTEKSDIYFASQEYSMPLSMVDVGMDLTGCEITQNGSAWIDSNHGYYVNTLTLQNGSLQLVMPGNMSGSVFYCRNTQIWNYTNGWHNLPYIVEGTGNVITAKGPAWSESENRAALSNSPLLSRSRSIANGCTRTRSRTAC